MIPSAPCAPETPLLSEIGPAGSLSVAMLLTGTNAPGGRGATLNENRTPSSVNVNVRCVASGPAAATDVSADRRDERNEYGLYRFHAYLRSGHSMSPRRVARRSCSRLARSSKASAFQELRSVVS